MVASLSFAFGIRIHTSITRENEQSGIKTGMETRPPISMLSRLAANLWVLKSPFYLSHSMKPWSFENLGLLIIRRVKKDIQPPFQPISQLLISLLCYFGQWSADISPSKGNLSLAFSLGLSSGAPMKIRSTFLSLICWAHRAATALPGKKLSNFLYS